MENVVRIGVDLAKQVLQIHAVDAACRVIAARAIARGRFLEWCVQLPAGCVVAMEASTSAHHWCRKLRTMGLNPKIIAAHLVAPYRMQGASGKNDPNDAAAICEAASRPHMHFVPVKTAAQQGVLSVHRLREGMKEERTACINRIRGLLAEFGIVIAQNPRRLHERLADILEDASNELDFMARQVLDRAFGHWRQLDEEVRWCDERIAVHNKENDDVKIAAQLDGIGPITASAVVATVGDFKQFRSGSQFGAWLGLTPRQRSSGGKASLGSITKRGDTYLRMLLIQAARSAVLSAHRRTDPISQWVTKLRDRSGWQKAAVALANKNARILWAVFAHGRKFDPHYVRPSPAKELVPA
jgi:transposase